jgi:hypothetical protein
VIIQNALRCRFAQFKLRALCVRGAQCGSRFENQIRLGEPNEQKRSPVAATTPDARIVAFFALSASTSEAWSRYFACETALNESRSWGERVVTFYGGREQILRGEHSWTLRS